MHYFLTVMLLKKTTNVLEEESWRRDMVLPGTEHEKAE